MELFDGFIGDPSIWIDVATEQQFTQIDVKSITHAVIFEMCFYFEISKAHLFCVPQLINQTFQIGSH